jgi:membrane protease YdiL (CAAX protease family)
VDRVSKFLERHSLSLGIIVMFLLTWPIALADAGILPFKFPFVVSLVQGYGIFFASLIMTWQTRGKRGTVALLSRFLTWRVGWRWYLVALLLVPAIDLVAVFINAALDQTPVDFSNVHATKIFGPAANLPLFILPFFVVDILTNGEEIGWRGYILPRLELKYSALTSALILAVIWGFWHLPRFLAPGNDSSFALTMIEIIARSVLLAWVYNNAKGSLLLVSLMHSAGNVSGVFLPLANTQTGSNQTTLAIATFIEIVVAIVIVRYAGAARLSRTEPTQELASISAGDLAGRK